MATNTKVTKDMIIDVIKSAKQHLQKKGWIQGDLFEYQKDSNYRVNGTYNTTGPACMLGALSLAGTKYDSKLDSNGNLTKEGKVYTKAVEVVQQAINKMILKEKPELLEDFIGQEGYSMEDLKSIKEDFKDRLAAIKEYFKDGFYRKQAYQTQLEDTKKEFKEEMSSFMGTRNELIVDIKNGKSELAYSEIPDFNDDNNTTVKDVYAAFDEAIKIAKAM